METNTEKLIEALQLLAESIDSADGVANAVIFESAQRLNELQAALQTAHASLVLARNERDEARAELKSAKDDGWRHYNRVGALEAELKQVRAEVDAIRNVISNAGFSEVVEPLERVKRLIQERDEAICKMGRLKTPQPDRLQIAATILAGSYSNCSNYNDLAKIGLKQADALIAAAKKWQ